ncbi:hypothetical protein SPRG_20184 [Saprolegnia parasitica CBS 223.65]|uniref:Uncharacterized protein n=1 Tax=Saprolegnia parasitica (strain CBS 223.65) TaxID=695850 RepID=A0A067CMG4_SAPPC|nr:hypothetical protein SPRG_20184 [Saprolegnia parasitica CBS 223.65]KDO28022.1 hypothetical protein SPRG_20184 [Saprolegnia parasitica CBS 223.65]|eukprot:XP_012201178.1 hypothetical protein SPRG_20184 [Saprolegnia parasitica CBS 223.65]
MSAAFKAEKEKLEDAILEQMRDVHTGLQTLNQNLDRLNDVGEELQAIAVSWTNYCDAMHRAQTDATVTLLED